MSRELAQSRDALLINHSAGLHARRRLRNCLINSGFRLARRDDANRGKGARRNVRDSHDLEMKSRYNSTEIDDGPKLYVVACIACTIVT